MYISDRVKLDAVLLYCEQRHTDAIQYGLAMGFFNKKINKLTKLGERVAKILLNKQAFETNEATL